VRSTTSGYAAPVRTFVAVGLLSRESIDEQLLLQLTAFLEAEMQTWLPTIPMRSNLAKRTALESIGLSPVIYSGPKLSPAAHAWKRGFNVAAKQVAWVSQYPAAFHEELIGWSEQPVDKPYRIIELRSSFEHEQVQKGFDVAFRLLSGKRPEPIVIEAAGDTLLKQLLWAIVLGDFVTIYTALASGIDPSQERLAYTFNQRMGE
jgi:glucose/mannose-6-phosphate isomerase